MKNFKTLLSIFLLVHCSQLSLLHAQNQPTTREMNLITWKEFQRFVPDLIETVLLPVGSLEPHGVIPNGTDNLAPEAMGREIALKLNALIAPTLNYGVTAAMAAYPGSITISPDSYVSFVHDIVKGLARQSFKNIIILNGHGGNTEYLKNIIPEISEKYSVRILIINWWSLTSEITYDVFGENGGHAGNNETAYIQAVFPDHIHPEWYDTEMAIPNAVGSGYIAVPVPASIGLYKEGEGYPTFDRAQSEEYFRKVNTKVCSMIELIIKKWDKAGLYR